LTTRLHINGHDFAATSNLVAYLRRARKFFRESGDCARSDPHWIDAICINQSDVAERNQEVRRMDTIYNSASMAVGWLGPSDEDTSRAMTLARDMFELLSRHVMANQPSGVAPGSRSPQRVP
jgi:hypothetical protein